MLEPAGIAGSVFNTSVGRVNTSDDKTYPNSI
jgi:hypothetical protein